VLEELTQGSGVRWRGRLLGPGRVVAEPLHALALLCLRRFGCCPDGFYVSAPARLAPPSSGPAARRIGSGAPSSLISSADSTVLALRLDKPPSTTAPQASPAAKTTGTEGQLNAELVFRGSSYQKAPGTSYPPFTGARQPRDRGQPRLPAGWVAGTAGVSRGTVAPAAQDPDTAYQRHR
jgi:hypothetical protein